jgi:xanthine dehydrogenase accessory factor
MDEQTRLLEALLTARNQRRPCVVATVVETTGSIPRAAGAKMLVYDDGQTLGTVGGGKFESLVIEDAKTALREKSPLLKTYPLHEGDVNSFGAICGGSVTVLIEPQQLSEALVLVGAGHCSRAIASTARDCGLHVTVIDDRTELLDGFPAHQVVGNRSPADFIANHAWRSDEALVIVSRNFNIDRDALGAALATSGMGYVGMIGSSKKVNRVFDELKESGVTKEQLKSVFAPIGLDIGADSPGEIAVSVMGEVLKVIRNRGGGHLRDLRS